MSLHSQQPPTPQVRAQAAEALRRCACDGPLGEAAALGCILSPLLARAGRGEPRVRTPAHPARAPPAAGPPQG